MKLILFIRLIIITICIQAQSNTDSIVMQYLRIQPNITLPFLEVTKKGNREIIKANYFIEANRPIIKDTFKISTFLFGSSASHSAKYFLIQVSTRNNLFYTIIGKSILEKAINEFFLFIKPYNLPDTDKAILLNQLSYTYY